jgi:hypothetical protein
MRFGQGLGGELGRLVTCHYRLDNLKSVATLEKEAEETTSGCVGISSRPTNSGP